VLAKILSQDPEDLGGVELLLFNIAYQLTTHDQIEWTAVFISEFINGLEETLEDLES
jgi:hypothetical protein